MQTKINGIAITIQNLIDYKTAENHAGAQHVSNFGGRDITWNLVRIKNGRYVTTTTDYGDAVGVVHFAGKGKFIGLPEGKTIAMVKHYV